MSGQDESRDAELSRLYREGATDEPPARLDEAILAAARREAGRAAPRRRRPWWRRWSVPVSVAALVVLSVSLSLLVSRERDRVESPAPAPVPAAPQDLAAPAAAPAPQEQTAIVPQPPGAAAEKRAPGTAPVPRERPAPPANLMNRKEETQGRGAFVQEPKAADRQAAPAALPPPAAGEAEAPSGLAADAAKEEAAVEPRTAPRASRILSPPAGLAAGGSQAGPLREAPQPPSAEAWIEEMRALRRQGREREAAERLEEFRRAYPGYALPEDLRQPPR